MAQQASGDDPLPCIWHKVAGGGWHGGMGGGKGEAAPLAEISMLHMQAMMRQRGGALA